MIYELGNASKMGLTVPQNLGYLACFFYSFINIISLNMYIDFALRFKVISINSYLKKVSKFAVNFHFLLQHCSFILNSLYENNTFLVAITPKKAFCWGVRYLATRLHDPAIFVLLL